MMAHSPRLSLKRFRSFNRVSFFLAVLVLFNLLAQGAMIGNFLGSDFGAKITHVGGDGNDVVLTVVAADVSVAVSPAAVDEDDSLDLVYTFTRTDTTGSLTVNFSVSGTADSGTDYTQTGAASFTPPSGTVTFADGSSTAAVNITPTLDADYEAHETVILTVTSGTGYNVGSPNPATGTITNDDAPPSFLEVTKTADTNDTCLPGDCSLREAINAANADPDPNVITFDIPTTVSRYYYADDGGGSTNGTLGALAPTTAASDSLISSPAIDPDYPHSWWSIHPTSSPLPPITYPVFIDGYSQRPCFIDPTSPCSETNTDANGDNAILLIELNGVKAGDGADGLVVTAGTTGNTIEGSAVFGLVINNFSGNGIKVTTEGGSFFFINSIIGNFIGTDVSGTLAAANGVGVLVDNIGPNMIGCTTADERNVISGNTEEGVVIVGAQADDNLVQGNLIGTDRTGTLNLGNGGSGVEIYTGGSGNIIGAFQSILIEGNRLDGAAAPQATSAIEPGGNVIAFNGGDGVEISSAPDLNNLISQNSIFNNVGLGINLVGGTEVNGVTANDNCDEDDGPNHLQNFPVVTSAFTDGGTTTIEFTLHSTVDETFTIEFFTNTTVDPSGYGEGRTFVDSTLVTISELDCSENFSFPVSELTPGHFVTATATDSFGNTSEFGPNRMVTSPTAADTTISGTIVDDNGAPVAGVVINLSGTQNRKTITNAKGSYFFDEVETSGFYTVTPSRANYSFTPSLRSFNQLGNHTDAAFTASAGNDSTNPLDTPEFFVRQQYVDILGREPDEGGFNYWSNEINRCGSDAGCTNARRRDIAAAFFIEQEFQQSGSYIYNLYSGGLGRKPGYAEYAVDRGQVVGGASLAAEKAAFALRFVQRADFVAKYQTSMSGESFVDALLQTVQQSSGVDLSSQRANLVTIYGSGANQLESRSLVLRQVAENGAFKQAEYNAAFVLTEYFGYLKRDAEAGGFDFWLNVLNNREPGNFRGMVCSFITSTEYQQRFSRVVTHSNAECAR